MHWFGVHLLGFDAENGKKLLLTCVLVTLVLLGRFGLLALLRTVLNRLARAHGALHRAHARVRIVKDAMSRAILCAFDEAGIGIASSTYDIVGVPPLRMEMARDGAPRMAHVNAQSDGSATAPRRR